MSIKLQSFREAKACTAGDVIAEMEQKGLSVKRSTVMSLVGSDSIRTIASYGTAMVGGLYKSVNEGRIEETIVYESALKSIGKKEALRAFSLFPRAITPESVRPYSKDEKEEFCDLNIHYAGIGLWLLNWHKGNKYGDALLEMGLGQYEKAAWVSRFRYDVCDYLKTHSQNKFIKSQSAALTWLLLESSTYRIKIEEAYNFKSKRQRYILSKNLWDDIADISWDEDKEVEPCVREKSICAAPKDVLSDFAGLCLFEARQLAIKDKDFDKLLWKKYLAAEKTWGRKALDHQGIAAYVT